MAMLCSIPNCQRAFSVYAEASNGLLEVPVCADHYEWLQRLLDMVTGLVKEHPDGK